MSKETAEMLANWNTLCESLLNCEDEKLLLETLAEEKKGQKRLQFMLRIYGRYNKLRGARERKDLMKLASEA